MDLSWITLRGLARSLPVVFALHVFEESLSFVQWFNARVEPDMSWRTFLTVTGVCFVVTTLIAAQLSVSRSQTIGATAAAWLGFLMLANGVVQVAASIVDGGYVPGVATALLLYLPLCFALVSGIPMYVQGWLVVFRGTSLI